MYANVGGKIKGLAKVMAWVGIIASIILGISTMVMAGQSYYAMPGILSGLVIMVLGSLGAWISSWVLYGFGEVVEKVSEIARNTSVSR